MATREECLSAIEELVDRLARADTVAHDRKVPDRTIGVHLLDLDITIVGKLTDARISGVHEVPGDAKPQVRVTCSSDDLIAMTNGELNFAHAWATGRVRLDASLRDLLRLRAFT